MQPRLVRSFSLLLGAIGVAGCYSPNLGSHPFRCDALGHCPDGYRCDTDSLQCINGAAAMSTVMPPIMIPRDAGAHGDAGAIGIECDPLKPLDWDLEPNDTLAEVLSADSFSHFGPGGGLCYPTSDAGCNPYHSYTKYLAICNAHDVDYYWIDLVAGDRVQFEIRYDVTIGDLDLAVVDGMGTILGSSATNGDFETVVLTAPATARYFMVVQGWMGQTGSYEVNLTKL